MNNNSKVLIDQLKPIINQEMQQKQETQESSFLELLASSRNILGHISGIQHFPFSPKPLQTSFMIRSSIFRKDPFRKVCWVTHKGLM